MDFNEVIKKRYSVRNFKNKPVEPEKLMSILDTGRLAPSAVNFQPWYFIVVGESSERESLDEVYPRPWFKTAPVVVIICADHQQSWKRGRDGKDFADIDAALAIDHMTLQAVNLGLGSCWVCNFDNEKCRSILQLPEYIEPIALLPIGYPNDNPSPKNRKSLEEIVFRGKFGARNERLSVL